jgi:hypothetical protein
MTAAGPAPPPRYRPGHHRQASTALLAGLAAGVAVMLLVALGARVVVASSSCGPPVTVHVAAAGEIEPALSDLARYFDRQHRQVAGHCAQVVVTTAAPAVTAAELAAGTPGRASAPEGTSRHRPAVDAWVPDSWLWVDLARGSRAGARRVPPAGPVIAESPLVIAMPRAVAARTPAFGASVSWRFLLPPAEGGPPAVLRLEVQLPDPTASAAGLATLLELRKLLGYRRWARFGLARFARNVQVVPAAAGGTLPPSLAAPGQAGSGNPANPVTVISEQAAARFDQAHPGQPLAVRYPAEGTYELSFPYLVTTASRPTAAAARAFGAVLGSRYASELVRYYGFRTARAAAAGWPAWYGLDPGQPGSRAVPRWAWGSQNPLPLTATRRPAAREAGSRAGPRPGKDSAAECEPTRGVARLACEARRERGAGPHSLPRRILSRRGRSPGLPPPGRLLLAWPPRALTRAPWPGCPAPTRAPWPGSPAARPHCLPASSRCARSMSTGTTEPCRPKPSPTVWRLR